MSVWRNQSTDNTHTIAPAAVINRRLQGSGLFEMLDRFFSVLVDGARGPQRIVIVTNAAIRTVEHFYLSYCMTQLRPILDKYSIPIRSTELQIRKCGAIPSPSDENAFREYYTQAKVRTDE